MDGSEGYGISQKIIADSQHQRKATERNSVQLDEVVDADLHPHWGRT